MYSGENLTLYFFCNHKSFLGFKLEESNYIV